MAIDRQNEQMEDFYDSHHQAVLRMIAMTVENAHRENIWCGICGELGADPSLSKWFVSIGVDELSMSPRSLLFIRKIIRETDVSAEGEQIKRQYL